MKQPVWGTEFTQLKAEKEEEKNASRRLAFAIGWAGLGFLLPGGVIYGGLSPFGVGLAAAATPPGSILLYLLTGVGYLAAQGVVFPLRYLAALLAIGGIRWVVSGIGGLTRSPLYPPLIAFLTTGVTGLGVAVSGGLDLADLLMVLAESTAAAGFAWFCRVAMQVTGRQSPRSLTLQEQTALILMGAVALMALSSFTVGELSPGRILAVMTVLLMARSGREQGGAIAGIVLGVTMLLGFPAHPYLAAAYGFGGLLAGVFSRFGRLAACGGMIAAGILTALNTGNALNTLVGLYETVGGCLLFAVMPPSLDRKINGFFSHARRLPAIEGVRRSLVMRLSRAARGVDEVADTVKEVAEKLAGNVPKDLDSLYRRASREVCTTCSMAGFCWEAHYPDTLQSFRDLSPLLQDTGGVTVGQVGGHLARHCRRTEQLVQQINREYMDMRVRQATDQRLCELRDVVTDQFGATAILLQELATVFSTPRQVDADAATRITEVCERYGLRVQDAVCSMGNRGRMTVEILATDTPTRLDNALWQHELENAAGREFDHPAITRTGEEVQITLCEKPRYRVEIGAAQLTCSGEKLCGDAYDTFADGNGHQFVVLSDGMGSGGRAAVDGAMAAGLTSHLIRAGLAADSVLRLVNTALMVKSEEESLSTLDIAAIDLYSGRVDSLKAGASTSLLRSMGRVSRMEQPSMPIGILKEASFARHHDTLVKGDILLIMSDGAVTHGVGWVEEALRDFDESHGGMSRLAAEIAAEARHRQQGGREDDITVIALQLHKAG